MEFSDEVVTRVDVHMGFLDRLRVLLRGKLHALVQVKTEHVVGATSGQVMVCVPPIFPRPPGGGREVVQIEAPSGPVKPAEATAEWETWRPRPGDNPPPLFPDSRCYPAGEP